MKKLLTILTVVCVMVASVVGFALFAAADGDAADNTVYTGTIENAVKRANAVLGATSSADKIKNVKDLDTYLIENPVKPDESAEYAAMVDLVEKAAAVGALVRLNSYNSNKESEFVYEIHTILNWAARTLETTPGAREYVIETLSSENHADFVKRTEGDERTTVGDLYDELKAHLDARLEVAKQTLFDAAPLTDNNGTYVMNYDMKIETHSAQIPPIVNAGYSSELLYKNGVDGDAYAHYYQPAGTSVPTSSSPYVNLSTGTYPGGSVLEFDFMPDSMSTYTNLSNTETDTSGIHQKNGGNGRIGVSMINFKSGGVYTTSNKVPVAEQVSIADVNVPGQWMHYALVFRTTDGKIDLYIDYQLVKTFTMIIGSTGTEGYTITAVTGTRFSFSNATIGFGLDNVKSYQGVQPRDVERMNLLGEAGRFVYYGQYIEDEAGSLSSMMFAYDEMGKLLSNFFTTVKSGGEVQITKYDGSKVEGNYTGNVTDENGTKKAIEQYYAYDVTAARREFVRENTAKYIQLVENAEKITRTYDSISARADAALVASNFATANVSYIDVADAGYSAAVAILEKLQQQIENDKASLQFVECMESFIKTKDTKYNALLKYYTAAGLTLENLDPIVNEESTLDRLDMTMPDARLATAIDNYKNAHVKLGVAQKAQNTSDFITYMFFTMNYKSSDAWEANYGALAPVITKARAVIKSGAYDENDENFIIAREWYDTIGSYFYDRLQEDHIAYITSLHDEYRAATNYVGRLSVVNRVADYIAKSDIDMENASIAALVDEHEGYKAQLVGGDVEYAKELASNADKFNSIVRAISVTDNYTDLTALLKVAEGYYYNMALDNPKNVESIALYKTFIEYKKLIETSSAEVISLVYLNLYDENGAPKELTIAEKYQLLAAAYRLTPFVEESISVVIKDAEENETVVTAAEALAEYEKLLAEYNALVGPVNGEILGMLDTVCALRFNCASAALLELFVSNANSK